MNAPSKYGLAKADEALKLSSTIGDLRTAIAFIIDQAVLETADKVESKSYGTRNEYPAAITPVDCTCRGE